MKRLEMNDLERNARPGCPVCATRACRSRPVSGFAAISTRTSGFLEIKRRYHFLLSVNETVAPNSDRSRLL